jgi:hypothetical protein
VKYYDAVMPLLSNILLNAQDKQVWGGGGLYLLLLTVVAGCVCVCVCLSLNAQGKADLGGGGLYSALLIAGCVFAEWLQGCGVLVLFTRRTSRFWGGALCILVLLLFLLLLGGGGVVTGAWSLPEPPKAPVPTPAARARPLRSFSFFRSFLPSTLPY